MRLQFWYSKGVKQWHWTLHTRHYAPKGKDYYHISGSGTDVREVMDKVATEVEKLVEERNNEEEIRKSIRTYSPSRSGIILRNCICY